MGRGRGQVELGSWIKVYWDGDDTWYSAEVTEFDPVTEWCKVLYEDGEREEFRLSDIKYKKIWGGKLKEKYQEEAAGSFSRKFLRYIHHTLVDMADRLPEFSVREDCRQWWEEWQDDVKKAAHSRNLSGLVKLVVSFGEQITVLDVVGKVDVTTAWWRDQSEDWQAKLKEATNYEDVASRVKDLLLRAVDWTAARNLFTSTDVHTSTTSVTKAREDETVGKELKRKEPVLETIIPSLYDRGIFRVESPPTGKRSKRTKKSLGDVTQCTQRREGASRDSPSGVGPLKTTKKRRIGDKAAEVESVDVQVQKDFGIFESENQYSSSPVLNLILPSDFRAPGSEGISRRTFLEELQEVQVPIIQSEKSVSDTFFSGTVVGWKKKRGRRKKKKKHLQDTGNPTAGKLGETFFLGKAYVIAKRKRAQKRKGRRTIASIAAALPSVDEGSICKADASSPGSKDHSKPVDLQNTQEGDHIASNISSATKIVANAKEVLKFTTSAGITTQECALLSEGAMSVTKQKEEATQAASSEIRLSEPRRKPGRPRKVVLAHLDFGLNVKVLNQADLDRRPRQMSFEAEQVQEKEKSKKIEVKSDLETTGNQSLQVESPLKSEKGAAGEKKEVQQRKRGRPRKVSQPPVMESFSNGNLVSDVVGGTDECNDVGLMVEDIELVQPRKRGRPKKSCMKEVCPVPLDPLHHIGSEDEENDPLWEPAPQRSLLSAAIKEPDDGNGITTRQEDKTIFVSKELVDQMQMQEHRAHAADKLDVDANDTMVAQSTWTSKKRGRPRKTRAQVGFLSHREVTSPSSPRLSSVSKSVRSGTLVSYKRRGRHYQTAAGSSRISQEEPANGGENSENQSVTPVAELRFHEEVAKNPSAPILMSSLSEEDQPETAVVTSRTGSSPVVSEDAPVNPSKPVVREGTERKYSRRHFRKSPGRPPRKVVQDERQELSTSASLSQSAARATDLLDSEAKTQPAWKEVLLTSGQGVGTGSSLSRSRLFDGSAIPVIVEENGNRILNNNHVQEAAICLALNRDVSAASNESPRRSKRLGTLPWSLERQALQVQHHDVGSGAVSSVGGNLQQTGHVIAVDETEFVRSSKKHKSGETEKRMEDRTGELVGITPTEDSGKDGLRNENDRFECRMGPILITATTCKPDSETKPGSSEVQREQQPQVEMDGLRTREAATVKIYVSGPHSELEAGLPLAPSDGTCKQRELAALGEEACVNAQGEDSDKSRIEDMQVESGEVLKIRQFSTYSTDDPCRKAEPRLEPEYPSWGDKLCTDSEDETETLPVCGDSAEDSNARNWEQELLRPDVPKEALAQPPLATETVSAVLKEPTVGSGIRAAVLPVASQVDNTCVPGKVSKVVSDIACDPGQVNGGQAVETKQTRSQNQKWVPAELMCNICNFEDAEDQMLLCEERSCTCAIHTFCLNPPLQVVPTDAWTCLHCTLMATQNNNVKICSPKRFPPKKIQAVIGRRSNLVKDEVKHSEYIRMEYLVKWDALSHWHDTWIDATWFVSERKRYATLFESRHSDLPKIDVTKEIDNTVVDERKPEWLLIDRVIKSCEHGGQLHPSELSRIGYKREGVQFLIKWQGLDYRNATWEETKFSKDMREAISAFISRHESAEMDDVRSHPGESVAASISRQPDYIHGGSMYGYQVQGLKWLLSNFEARKSVILADEMGFGKTVQAIAFMSCVRNEKLSKKPVLVVAPKSTLSEWEEELQRWAPGLNAVVYQGEKDNRDVIRRCEFYTESRRPLFEVLLTSYELAIQDNRYLCKFDWAAIIVDEGHRMRNMRSKLGGVLKEHQAEFRLLLTGTPVQNTLAELFSLFHFLDPVEFPNPDSAAGEFMGAVNDGNADFGAFEAKSKQLSKFHELLKSRMLRRVKTEVPGVRMPGRKIVEVSCSLTSFQRHLYTAVLKKNHGLLNRGVQAGLKRSLNNILTDLKMVCNHPYLFPEKEPQGLKSEDASRMMVDVSGKLLFLEKVLPMLKEGGHRVLLFSQMTRMLDIIEDFLDFLGLSFCRIDGSTSTADRQRAISDFNRPECTTFIFLSSTGAGGLGINLQRSADTIIIYDPDFNPFLDLQAQALAHQIGKDKIVLVYQLVTEGSVEEKILERSKKKLALENMVVTSGMKSPSQMKEKASDISDVLLHGLDHILDENHVKALCIEHTFESVQKLLDRSIPKSSSGVHDDYVYLGAVRGHEYIVQDGGKDVGNIAEGGYGEKWRELLNRLVEREEKQELGRGKRTRKQVSYSVEQNVDGQEECKEDDEYNPTSSSDESSSDVSLEAEGSNPSSISGKTTDLRQEIGREGDVSKLQNCPGSLLLDGEVVARNLSSVASRGAVQCTSKPSGTLPPLHGISTPGNLGTFSLPLGKQTGIVGPPGQLGVAPHPVVTGSSVTSSGLVYDRVVSSQGIGIHLNRLIPASRGNVSVQAPFPPTPSNNCAVLVHTGPSVRDKPVQFSGSVPSLGSNGALGISGSLGGSTGQFASPHSLSGPNSTVCGYTGLPGGDKSVQDAVCSRPAVNRRMNCTEMPGGRKSLQAAGSAPSTGLQSVDVRYSASQGGRSVQSVPSPAPDVSPVSTPCVASAVSGSSVLSNGGQSAQLPLAIYQKVAPSKSCVTNGQPNVFPNSIRGSSPGMHSPQSGSNVYKAATDSTRVSGIPKLISDNVATEKTDRAVSQLPILDQTTAYASCTKLVLSSAGLKKSARNRHRLGVVSSGAQVISVINNTNPTSATAARVLHIGPVVSPSVSQASKPGGGVPVVNQSSVQSNPSLLSVPAFCPTISSLKDTDVSSLHAKSISVPVEATQTVGTAIMGKQRSPCNPLQEEVIQGLNNQTVRETSVAGSFPNPLHVGLPPIARAQAQRKPLWVPKGDAGLFMGPVRNM